MTSPSDEPDVTDGPRDSGEPSADPFAGADWDAAGKAVAPGTAPPPRRRRRTSRRRLRRRRRVGWAMLLLGGAIVALGAYLVVTGLMARSQLETIRTEAHQIRGQISTGNFAAARATARNLAAHARRADDLTSGPIWALGAAVPGDGNPVRTVRTITAQADTLGTHVLPQLVAASRQLDPATLRAPGGTINLSRISAAVPALDQASNAMSHATRTIAAQPAHTWLGVVDSARSSLVSQLNSLAGTVRSADLAARIAPQLLGQDGVKRYFVGFQNEAEARGTGGLPGAFAILRADHGKVSFERFESDSTLGRVPVNLDFGPGYRQLFNGANTTTLYGNSNLSPHFPYAAQIWLAMWAKHSGEKLDGAMAVDPTALSYLLRVTGPARLPDHTQISAANVVALTQSTVYAKFSKPAQNTQRRNYLLAIARAASRQVVDSRASTAALVKAAGVAAGERRLLVYSTDSSVESDLEQTSLSGAIPQTTAPYMGLSIVNDGGNKLDYYLNRSLTWQRTGCGSSRDVTVTVRLRNNAPASGLSPYVTGRSDPHSYPTKPGDNRLDVSFYATRGALMESVDVNGKASTSGVGNDLGHAVFTVELEVPRGTTGTIVWHLREPAGSGAPVVMRQPLVHPLAVRVHDTTCS